MNELQQNNIEFQLAVDYYTVLLLSDIPESTIDGSPRCDFIGHLCELNKLQLWTAT